MEKTYPFSLKFIIFDENKKITDVEKKIRMSLIFDDLRYILKKIFSNDKNYKFLDRFEPAMATKDESKQLRLKIDSSYLDSEKYHYSLEFHQWQSEFYFTLEELKYVSIKIKEGLEGFLNYNIDTPIIYIEADHI